MQSTRKTTFGVLMAAALASTAALAQIQQDIPKPPQESRPRGGGGFGLSIDLGSVLNAIRNAVEQASLPPPLAKQATAVTPQPGGGYTIDWVVQYANTTNATQTGVTLVDGPIATIIPSSLQQPAGWVGTTNATPPVDNWVKWTGNAPPLSGTMSAAFPAMSAASFNPGAASGDGFRAIPYRRAGVLRIYYFNHHIGGAAPPNDVNTAKPFGCIDTATGNPCPGFPKALPKGDGSGRPSAVSFYPEEYHLTGGLLFYAVTARGATGWDWGLGCYDLNNDVECGFYPLGSLPASHSGEAYVKGPWRVGSELYLIGADRRLYCMDAVNPSAFCSGLSSYGTGYQLPAGAFPYPGPLHYWGPAVFGEVAGSRLYLTTDSNPQSGWSAVAKQLRTFCFDAVAKSACAGWTVAVRTVTGVRTTSFHHFDAGMVPRHVCVRLKGASQSCVDIASGTVSSPPVVFPAFNSAEGFGSEVVVGARTYFPDYHLGDQSVKCWDWGTQAACAPTASYPAWTASPKNYAVNVDDQGCLWVLGDNANATWNFDPTKPLTNGKATRCGGREGTFLQVFEPWRYCSGPKPFAWTAIEVTHASLSDFTKLILRVKDAGGSLLLTYDALANGSLSASLAGIDPQTNGQPLRVEVEYALAATSTAQPELVAHYRASPLEFCFKSRHDCGQGPISNTVGVTEPAVLQLQPVTVHLPLPESCATSGGPGSGAGNGPGTGGSGGGSPAGGSGGAGGNAAAVGAAVGGALGAMLGSQAQEAAIVDCPPGITDCRTAQSSVSAPPKRCYWRPKARPASAPAKQPATTARPKPATAKAAAGTATKPASAAAPKPASSGSKPKPKPRPKPAAEMEWVCED